MTDLIFHYRPGENPSSTKRQKFHDQVYEKIVELEEYIGDMSEEHHKETGDYLRPESTYIPSAASAVRHMHKIEPYLNSIAASRWDPLIGLLIDDYKYNAYPGIDQTIKCGVGCRYDCADPDSNRCALGYGSGGINYRATYHTGTNLCTNTECEHFSGNIREPGYIDAVACDVNNTFNKPYSLHPFLCKRVTGMSVNAPTSSLSVNYYDIDLNWWTPMATLAADGTFTSLVELDYDVPIAIGYQNSAPTRTLTIVTDAGTLVITNDPLPHGGYRYVSDDGSTFTLGVDGTASSTFVASRLDRMADNDYRFPMGRRVYRVVPPTERRTIIAPSIVAKDDFSLNPDSVHLIQGTQTIFTNEENLLQGSYGVHHPTDVLLGYSGLQSTSTYKLLLVTGFGGQGTGAQSVQIYDPNDKAGTLTTLDDSQVVTPTPHMYLYDLEDYSSVYSGGSLVVNLVKLTNQASISKVYVIEMAEVEHPNYGEDLMFPELLDLVSQRQIPPSYVFLQDCDGLQTICNTDHYKSEGVQNSVTGEIQFKAGWFESKASSPNCFDFDYYGEALQTEGQHYHIVCTGVSISRCLGDILTAYWNHVTDPQMHMTKDRICNYIKNPYICCEDVGTLELQASDYDVDVGQTVTFIATVDLSLFGDEEIKKTYFFSMGDGSNFVVFKQVEPATITYTYTTAGVYRPSVRVYIDKQGVCNMITVSGDIIVRDVVKVDDVKYKVEDLNPLFARVYFQSEVSSVGAVKYLWDFGDGGISKDPNPTHDYEKGRAYTITLTVEDSNLGRDVYNVGKIRF